MDTGKQFKDLGSCGGRDASATSGCFTAGTPIAGQGGYRGGVGNHSDLRGGNANAASGYNQGNQFAAETGGDNVGSHKDLRGGTAATGGYNQGNQK